MSTKVSKRKASQFEETISTNERAKEKQAKTSSADIDHDQHDNTPPHSATTVSDPFTPPLKAVVTNSHVSIESVALPSMAALTLATNSSAPPSPSSGSASAVQIQATNTSPLSSSVRARDDGRDLVADPRSVKRSRAAVKLSNTFPESVSQVSADPGDDSSCPHAIAAVDSACVQMRQISISSFSMTGGVTSEGDLVSDSKSPGHRVSGLETMNQSLGVSLIESAGAVSASNDRLALPSNSQSDADSECDEVPQLPVISRRLNDTYPDRIPDDRVDSDGTLKARHSIYESETSTVLDDDASSVQSITSTQVSVDTAASSTTQSIQQPAIRCELCNKDLSGVTQYEAHILGRKHVHAALIAACGGKIRCDLCCKVFTCMDDREKHMQSDKHKKNAQLALNSSSVSPRSHSTADELSNPIPSRNRRTMSSNSVIPDDSVNGVSKKRKFGRSSPIGSLASAASPTPVRAKTSRDNSDSHSSPSQHSIRYLTPLETCADPPLPVARLHHRLSESDRSCSNSPIPVSRVSSSGRSSGDPSILRSPERIQPSQHTPQSFVPHPQYFPNPSYPMPSALPFSVGQPSAQMYAFLSPAALAALNGPGLPSLTPVTILYPTDMIMNHQNVQPPMIDPHHFAGSSFWQYSNPPSMYPQYYVPQNSYQPMQMPMSMPLQTFSPTVLHNPQSDHVTSAPLPQQSVDPMSSLAEQETQIQQPS